jgi:hypothetical protein
LEGTTHAVKSSQSQAVSFEKGLWDLMGQAAQEDFLTPFYTQVR